jgi:hypothetical protein
MEANGLIRIASEDLEAHRYLVEYQTKGALVVGHEVGQSRDDRGPLARRNSRHDRRETVAAALLDPSGDAGSFRGERHQAAPTVRRRDVLQGVARAHHPLQSLATLLLSIPRPAAKSD